MYLRKVEGPRAVQLPDGSYMSRADLPPPETRRWVASRKAAVVKAVTHGLISRETALEDYSLSDDEFDSWINAVARHGEVALKATALKRFRKT
ncbi:CtrA inhibitor SciP [Pseudoroseicyclus sp. H15]